MQFKINARKINILVNGFQMFLEFNEDKKNQYIQDVIKADFAEAGDEDVFRKIKSDLIDKNISMIMKSDRK